MAYLIAFLTLAAITGVYVYAIAPRVSPDGRRYILMAEGQRQPLPFHLRWLIPKIVGTNPLVWQIVTPVCLLGAAMLVYSFGIRSGLSEVRALFAAVLFAGLPIYRTNVELPILVDAPAMVFAIASASLAMDQSQGIPFAAIGLAIVGATIKEYVPIFAALATLNPWLLIGLIAPIVRRLLSKPAKPDHPAMERPFRYAMAKQSPRLLDPLKMIFPWAICLLALWSPTPAMVASLAVAYGMLFVAADSTRIFQWAFIPVCIQAAMVVPDGWLLPLAIAHLFNPFRGEI